MSTPKGPIQMPTPTGWRKEYLVSGNGKRTPVTANVLLCLRNHPDWVGTLGYNELSRRVVTLRETPWNCEKFVWRDSDDVRLADWLQQIEKLMIRPRHLTEIVECVSEERSFHPVQQYLAGLQWDGVLRLDNWLTTHMGAVASPYVSCVGKCWMISAVARAIKPGIKADHCLILEGQQGTLKSTGVQVLGEPWFTDDVGEVGTKDTLDQIQNWIVELGELDSISKTDAGKLKAFMSRQTDRFRPPYGRRVQEFPRQCVFVGTCNPSQYLRDGTGGRRFWPVTAGKIDIPGLRRDKDQLWAEAYRRYCAGERWWISDPVILAEARKAQAAKLDAEAWVGKLLEWCEKKLQPKLDGTGKTYVTMAEILEGFLNLPIDKWVSARRNQTQIGSALIAAGWKRSTGHNNEARYAPPSV